MPTTPKGISFEELEGSPTISIHNQGITAIRVFKVAWDSYINFCQEIIGIYKSVGTAVKSFSTISLPGLPATVLVEDIKVEPFEPTNPDGSGINTITDATNRYSGGAKVTVTYKQSYPGGGSHSPNVPADTFLTYSLDLGAEYFTVPGRAWHWVSSGKPVPSDVPIGILEPLGNHLLAWHHVVKPPVTKISQLRGFVNYSPFLGAGAGQVLFLGAKLAHEFRFNEQDVMWRVDYTFAEKQPGWNLFYNPDTGSYQEIQDAGGLDPYKTDVGNFADLFKYEP